MFGTEKPRGNWWSCNFDGTQVVPQGLSLGLGELNTLLQLVSQLRAHINNVAVTMAQTVNPDFCWCSCAQTISSDLYNLGKILTVEFGDY